MKLSKRLLMAASFVENASVVADIGTDHAYLPVYLILNGFCDHVFAADIGKGPLANAEKTVKEYELEDRITLVLSDGLKSINLDKTDTVILAGMGGDLISDILSAADNSKLKKQHIIAQPQSHSEKVRLFFMQNGFEIREEKICFDAKHIYICMSAFYTGRSEYPDSYEYYGELLKNESELVRPFIEGQMKHMIKKREALIKSGTAGEEAEKLIKIIADIKRAIGEK